MPLTIRLPLPPKECHPNVRCHRMQKARAMKKCRGDCKMLAIAAMREQKQVGWDEGKVMVVAKWRFTTARQRDEYNLNASLKAAFDGLQDAGVVKNDSQFITGSSGHAIVKDSPCVILVLDGVRDLGI